MPALFRPSPGARLLLALMFTLTALTLPAQPALGAPQADTFVVDREGDTDINSCTSAPNDCNLRGAINRANATTNATITFDSSVNLIGLLSPLPTVTGTGTAIVGSGGRPRLDAYFMPPGDPISINGDNIVISGISIINAFSDAGQRYSSIYIAGGRNIEVRSNYIGTLPHQPEITNCPPNVGSAPIIRNAYYGIWVGPAVVGDLSTPAVDIWANTIGCHQQQGIVLHGADYVNLEGNRIGVNINGVAFPNGSDGIALRSVGANGARFNTIKNNIIAGNAHHGILLEGNGNNNTTSTSYNVISNNLIGLRTNGTQLANGMNGISLVNGAFQNRIGGTADAERNIISGNGQDGIHISRSNGNGVLGNYIGLIPSGYGRLGNGGDGIEIVDGAANMIGSYLAVLIPVARENYVAANGGHGIQVRGSGSQDTFINSNRLGTTIASSLAGNSLTGIHVSGLAATTVITGNYISASGAVGIWLNNAVSPEVKANYINSSGHDGIALTNGTTYAVIGGLGNYDRNSLQLNARNGILVRDLTTINNSLINNDIFNNGLAGIAMNSTSKNSITRDASYWNTQEGIVIRGSDLITIEQAYIVGNGRAGVLVENSRTISLTGGTSGENRGAGIAVKGASSSGNRLQPAYVDENRGPAIDLGDDGWTPNDPGDVDSGPNALLNYPVITSASGNSISGTACANCTVLIYRAYGDPARGGGGSILMQASTDGSGNWSVTLPSDMNRLSITLMACEGGCAPGSNTSEMSQRPLVLVPLVTRQ